MAARIPQLSHDVRVRQFDVEADQVLTPALIDEAVETVLSPYDEATQERYRAAWAFDETSEVARLLQSAIVSQGSRLRSYSGISRRPVTITQQLSTDEQQSLVRRFPDMDLRFIPSKKIDHSSGNADRLLYSIKLHSNLPTGMKYVDFGGSIVMHVEQGNTDVLVVGGLHDVKDGARNTMARLRLKILAESEGVSDVTRNMARSVLAGEGTYYKEGSLQNFSGNYLAGVFSHVYDVPLRDIPAMMNRCGMLIFEGVVHFSDRFYFEEEGELPDIGARFRIKDGEFQMGFVDSPSHWYGHNWEEFRQYGCSQIFYVKDACYSYQVRENRGDTILFRILRMTDFAKPVGAQYARRPGVQMVSVVSYEHKNIVAVERHKLARTARLYPEDVWNRMVRSAMFDAAKGELDFSKHVKSYRTIIAGHKYNGVSTVTSCVDMTEVPWLVVDSALYGLGQVVMMRRTARAFVQGTIEMRNLADAGLLSLSARAFLTGLSNAIYSLTVEPLKNLVKWLMSGIDAGMDKLVQVSVSPQIVCIDSGTMVHGATPSKLVEYDGFPLREQAAKTLALEEYVNAVLKGVEEDRSAAPKADASEVRIEGKLVSDGGTLVASTEFGGSNMERPEWVPMEPPGSTVKEMYSHEPGEHDEQQRRDAIVETIRAVSAESAKVETWCMNTFAKFAGGRAPDADEVARVSEQYNNLDFWYVKEGAIDQVSLLGVSVTGFSYSGVYCPRSVEVLDTGGAVTNTHLLPVSELTYENKVKRLFRTYFSIPVDFTGYVLVCDGIKVLNGLHIAQGLAVASNIRGSYEMAGMIGGPGCGKTYSILKNYKKGDLVLTPLRLSAIELRKRLVSEKGLTPHAAHKVVRTFDSLLVEAGRNGGYFGRINIAGAFNVHVDECFNTNAGRVYAALNLVGAGRVMMYGDNRQIEHVVRADIDLLYKAVRFSHVIRRFTVFRSCPQVLAVFNGHYGNTLRTANRGVGTVTLMKGEKPVINKDEDVMLLVMNQASKSLVMRAYPALSGKVSTVHEAQGGEADKVVLFNFEPRKIGPENPMYLYNKPTYVNVAVSRAKLHFVYCFVSDYDDLVKQWVRAGESPAAIGSCSDLDSAGGGY